MKLQELNQEELNAVNGGSDSATNSGIAGVVGIGNLFSSSSYSKDGDEESASHTSIGNGINADLGALFNSFKD
ncbi:MAG: hypothetical protein V4687_07305 [Bacteroidota bacterium]